VVGLDFEVADAAAVPEVDVGAEGVEDEYVFLREEYGDSSDRMTR
jgi:hypothetical protein